MATTASRKELRSFDIIWTSGALHAICIEQARLGERDSSCVDDVIQDVLLKVLRSLPRWNGTSRRRFLAWVCRIARRSALRPRKRIDHWSVEHETAVAEIQASLKIHSDEQVNRKLRELSEAPMRDLTVPEVCAWWSSRRHSFGVARTTVTSDLKTIGNELEKLLEKF